jgi:4'-phosphopantetheinyl transferase
MVKVLIAKGDKSLSHTFLFDVLKNYYSISASDEDLKKTEYGKYYLEGYPVHFNISHSKDNIIIAVGESEVGVDTEVVKEEFRVRRIFGVIPKSAKTYAELFTKAEAIVKYKASSILLDLKKIDLSNELPVYDGEVLPINLFTFTDGDKVITVATTDYEYSVIHI